MPALSPIVDRRQPAVINGLAALPPLVTMMFISNDKKVTGQIWWKSLRDNRTFRHSGDGYVRRFVLGVVRPCRWRSGPMMLHRALWYSLRLTYNVFLISKK